VSAGLLAFSTVASAEDGERIARALVERGLAACVNVLAGALSVYRWEGGLQRESECLLVIKTNAERFDELRRTLVELHGYELPELIATRIEAGHQPYLDWMDRSLRREPAR
jgi:periplasmic divalent cation tolerance protein